MIIVIKQYYTCIINLNYDYFAIQKLFYLLQHYNTIITFCTT